MENGVHKLNVRVIKMFKPEVSILVGNYFIIFLQPKTLNF